MSGHFFIRRLLAAQPLPNIKFLCDFPELGKHFRCTIKSNNVKPVCLICYWCFWQHVSLLLNNLRLWHIVSYILPEAGLSITISINDNHILKSNLSYMCASRTCLFHPPMRFLSCSDIRYDTPLRRPTKRSQYPCTWH